MVVWGQNLREVVREGNSTDVIFVFALGSSESVVDILTVSDLSRDINNSLYLREQSSAKK